MKAKTEGTGLPSPTSPPTGVTGSAGARAQAKIAPEPCRRLKLPPSLEASAPLGYTDVGLFFVAVFFLAVIFRLGVYLHLLSRTALDNPRLSVQVLISLALIGSLYAIVRLRHGPCAWTLLGWSWPRRIYVVAALLGGIGLGFAMDMIARATTPATYLIRAWNLVLLDGLLGPVIEESFFRGCLLPVIAHRAGPTLAILAASVLFATLHPVHAFVQWFCFVATGTALGWIRVKSGSTAASALLHAVYNATLFFCQAL